jgi:DNA-binding NtrC family response regulator
MRGRILVVDDDLVSRRGLADALRARDFMVDTAADAFKALGKCETFCPEIIITDLLMPGMDGVGLLQELRERGESASVIILTGASSVRTAVDAIRGGAVDYMTKPVDLTRLLELVEAALPEARARAALEHPLLLGGSNIIGASLPMRQVMQTVERVAASRATVLVTGESGTGKEVIANAIHERSPRAAGPLVKLHCAALADTLLESELFGHERGSFTGASTRTEGRLQAANGGTLFLDEIGETSQSTQVKLLRFLQEHEIERVGGTRTIRVDVRIVAATNRDLRRDIATGRFREDLYYRLNVVAIELPPLRDRKVDIPALAQFFIARYAPENGKAIEGVEPDTLALLTNYDWPGNVRELENAIERAVVLSTGPLIAPDALPPTLHAPRPPRPPALPGATIAEIERYAIVETMKAVGGVTAKAARVLGISQRTIQYRMQQYQQDSTQR